MTVYQKQVNKFVKDLILSIFEIGFDWNLILNEVSELEMAPFWSSISSITGVSS